MIKIAICDGSETDSNNIQGIITECMRLKDLQCSIITFNSSKKLIDYKENFNIVFLDVKISEGIDGILAGQIIRKKFYNTKIIYVASFMNYMKDAFNVVHAYAYLNKPIIKNNVEEQLYMVLDDLQDNTETSVKVTFEGVEKINDRKTKSLVRTFNINEIYYFEYINRKVLIRTRIDKFYIIDNMKNVSEKMNEYEFTRCHQSYLVNLQNVNHIKGYDLYMKNDDILPVSQKRAAEFRASLNMFIQTEYKV